MNTVRILTLKLGKRLHHYQHKYASYLYSSRPTTHLPQEGAGRKAAQLPPVIFFGPAEMDAIAHEAQTHSPLACRTTVEAAERTCDGEGSIFGQPVYIGTETKWQLDHATGRTWPKIPAPRVQLIYSTDTSDIKAPWELARFQFLGALARAWAYLRHEKFPRKARELIESFQTQNPIGIGIHWTIPMEAAIRAANWIMAAPFFANAPGWDDSFMHQLRLSLYDHGRFIRTHLERHGRGINNNHYTADRAGLFIIGLFLADIDECRRWSTFALDELDKELDRQIAPDGMHYENSFGYHRLSFEMYFFTHRLALQNGFDRVRRWEPALKKMADFTQAITMPNGRAPNFGDNDDGVWFGGTPRPADDHRYLIMLSAAAFGDSDPAYLRSAREEIPEDVFWYCGLANVDHGKSPTARMMLNNPPGQPRSATTTSESHRVRSFGLLADGPSQHAPDCGAPNHILGNRTQYSRCEPIPSSRVFEASGIIVMRSRDGYVMVSANPVGTGGIGGHKHNDLLSYIFAVGDFEIVVDPGTYAYTAQPALRNCLRSTGAHNTVTIDGAEQNRFFRRQLFWVREDAHPRVVRWESNAACDRLIVQHDGYRRLPGEVIHLREFVFDKYTNTLVVRDELAGRGVHEIMSVTNLGEGTIHVADQHCVELAQKGDSRRAGFYFASGPSWQSRIEPCWHSKYYRRKSTAFRLVRRCRTQLPIRWVTAIGVFADGAVNWRRLEHAAAGAPTKASDARESFPDVPVCANQGT